MRQEARYGAILIAGSAVLLMMAIVHPSAIPFGDRAALARMTLVDAVAHSLAILGTWLLLVGQVGLSRMLGMQRTVVMAALVASALPAAGILVAAALDGFVIPKIAEEWIARGRHRTRRAGATHQILRARRKLAYAHLYAAGCRGDHAVVLGNPPRLFESRIAMGRWCGRSCRHRNTGRWSRLPKRARGTRNDDWTIRVDGLGGCADDSHGRHDR